MGRPLRATASAVIAILLLGAPLAFPPLTVLLDPFNGVVGPGFSGLPSGDVVSGAVPGEARVYWDGLGVPHIYATSDEAGAYSLGYIMASLRLFQMDLLRRLPQGRLAELVGEPGLDSDRVMRTLNMDDHIAESWRRLAEGPELRELARLVEHFVMGVNDYTGRASLRDLPPEYRLLGLRPEPWRPEDVIAIQKLFTMILAWDKGDLVLHELVRRWGYDIVFALDIPARTRNTPQARCEQATRWGDALGLQDATRSTTTAPTAAPVAQAPESLPPAGGLVRLIGEPLAWLGTTGSSNNWVIGGPYTASGRPLVANDPHLALTAPSLWIPLHLKTPTVNVAGVTVAGAPVVIIGRNEHIAWGFTNVMGDFADFYYYRWDGNRYLYKGEWREAQLRVEKIKVWDPRSRSYRFEEHRVLETVHGPVMEVKGERMAVAFTGARVSFELAFNWGLNRARSVEEALWAQRHFTAPIQNLVVADSQGGFAYSPVGAYPLRVNLPEVVSRRGERTPNRGFLPFNGSRGEGEWAGTIKYSHLPILKNPPAPFIVTANAKPFDGGCGAHIGWNYADRFRQDRITGLLTELQRSKGRITIDDVKAIQTNTERDLSLEASTGLALSLLGEPPAELQGIVRGLQAWLNQGAPTTRERWEPSLALAWAWELRRGLWTRLYGGEEEIGFFRIEYAERLLEAHIRGEEWAHQYLPKGGGRELSLESLRRALDTLKTYHKTEDYTKWSYGSLLYYSPDHPILKPYSYRRLPASGGPYSVNPSSPSQLSPTIGAPVKAGASVRLISDLATTELHMALPGGVHGSPHSPYYQNLYTEYWQPGRYFIIDLAATPETLNHTSLLVIRGPG